MSQTTYIPRYGQDIDAGDLSVNGLALTLGEAYYLDPTSGSDSNDGKSWSKAFQTLPVAYAALTANKNQTLFYIAGTSSISLTAAFTWAKSYTHFIGVAAPTGVANRSRIFQGASATGLSPLITISGSGCIWKNIYVFQGVDDATSLIAVRVTGSRNYFEDCHFAGAGHASDAIDGAASLNLSSASENRFVRCTIGVDTIGAATGVDALLISGTGCARNKFEECLFTLWASNAGAAFVELSAIDSIDRYTLFKRCSFLNMGTSMTSGIVVPAGFDTANKRLFMQDCMGFGVTKWDTNDLNFLVGNMGAITGADLSGVAVALRA